MSCTKKDNKNHVYIEGENITGTLTKVIPSLTIQFFPSNN